MIYSSRSECNIANVWGWAVWGFRCLGSNIVRRDPRFRTSRVPRSVHILTEWSETFGQAHECSAAESRHPACAETPLGNRRANAYYADGHTLSATAPSSRHTDRAGRDTLLLAPSIATARYATLPCRMGRTNTAGRLHPRHQHPRASHASDR